MRNVILLASALLVSLAACDERILPPPLGEGGAGGEEAQPVKKDLGPDTEALSKGACPDGVKCSGRW